MNLLFKLFTSTVSVFIAAQLVPGIQIADLKTALVFAVVLGIVNTIIKPLLSVLTMPITILTLGLFSLILNGLMVLLAAYFVDGVVISSIWYAIVFCIVMWIINTLLNLLGN